MASHQIQVTIVGAQGLRDTDGASGPFCVGEIYRDHKNSGCFQTKAASDSANPVWNHEHLWTEYEEGDKVVFTIFANSAPDAILGRTELESSQFRSQPFEGELLLSHAGEGVTARLTVKVAVLDEAVPVVIERVSGPMALHDLLRPQDAPHVCSQPARTFDIMHPVTATTTPHVPTKFTVATPLSVRQFHRTNHAYRSKSIGPVGVGMLTRPATTFVRGPVRAIHAAIPPPCATLPARSSVAVPAGLGGTGRLTPSFSMRTGGALQPCAFLYQSERSVSPARFVAAPSKKAA